MATITITTNSGQDSRIAAAFGARLGLPGNASAAQIKGDLVTFLKKIVREYEQRAASITASAGVTDVDAT
jgi:hypothetical protein